MTATLKDFCGWSPPFLFALGFSVWKDSNIGTIFYRNHGIKEMSVAKQVCDDANQKLTAAAGIKDKNIVHISLPDPPTNFSSEEFQFYQALSDQYSDQYSDNYDGFWLKSDVEELQYNILMGLMGISGDAISHNMRQAVCTFICRKRGLNFYINS